MDEKRYEELKERITEFIEEKPTESAILGVGALLATGYCLYKLFSRKGKEATVKAGARPEDTIKEGDITPGNPDDLETGEEAKAPSKRRFVPQSDSEDEPMLLRQNIKPKRDNAGVLDRDTLVRIFDKRSTIKGMRKLDRTFKEKRRSVFKDPVEYKNVISFYHNEIEKRRESNLEYICRALNVSIEDIENSQEKYFGDRNLAFELGTKDFNNIQVPSWLTLDIALEIYDDIKDMLQAELIQLNSMSGLDEEARELEMAYIQYKVQDTLFFKHKVEEEHLKKVLYENGIQ